MAQGALTVGQHISRQSYATFYSLRLQPGFIFLSENSIVPKAVERDTVYFRETCARYHKLCVRSYEVINASRIYTLVL